MPNSAVSSSCRDQEVYIIATNEVPCGHHSTAFSTRTPARKLATCVGCAELLREVHAAQQRLEARIGAERVERRAHF